MKQHDQSSQSPDRTPSREHAAAMGGYEYQYSRELNLFWELDDEWPDWPDDVTWRIENYERRLGHIVEHRAARDA